MIKIKYDDIVKSIEISSPLTCGAFTEENFKILCERVKNYEYKPNPICEVVVPVKWIMEIEDESFDELKEAVKNNSLVMLEHYWYNKVMGYYFNKRFPIDKR